MYQKGGVLKENNINIVKFFIEQLRNMVGTIFNM